MKLNVKQTIKIGFGFLTVMMLWQVYNYYCPLFLKALFLEQFGTDKSYLTGVIMAMDNVLALFMLPLFGSLSDKTHSKKLK